MQHMEQQATVDRNYWPPALSAIEEIGWVIPLLGLSDEEIEQRVFDERRRRLERRDYPEGFFDGPRFVLSLERPKPYAPQRTGDVAPACQSNHGPQASDTPGSQLQGESTSPARAEEGRGLWESRALVTP